METFQVEPLHMMYLNVRSGQGVGKTGLGRTFTYDVFKLYLIERSSVYSSCRTFTYDVFKYGNVAKDTIKVLSRTFTYDVFK